MKIRSWWMRSIFAMVNTSLVMNLGGCTVENGHQVDFNIIPNKPSKVEENANYSSYTYDNKKYIYDENGYVRAFTGILTLISQHIRNNIQNDNNLSDIWNKFINSDAWKKESFKSINYDIPKPKDNNSNVPGFIAAFGSNPILIEPDQNDDFSSTDNLVKYYVMTPSLTLPHQADDLRFNLNDLKIPQITNNENVTVTGYLYSYVNIGDFKLEFNIVWDFVFKKIADKKGNTQVFLTKESRYPINVDVNTSLDTLYRQKIRNLAISIIQDANANK